MPTTPKPVKPTPKKPAAVPKPAKPTPRKPTRRATAGRATATVLPHGDDRMFGDPAEFERLHANEFAPVWQNGTRPPRETGIELHDD